MKRLFCSVLTVGLLLGSFGSVLAIYNPNQTIHRLGLPIVVESRNGQNYLEFLAYVQKGVTNQVATQQLQNFVKSRVKEGVSPLVILDGVTGVVVAQIPVDKFTACFGGTCTFDTSTKAWYLIERREVPNELKDYFVRIVPDIYLYQQVVSPIK